MNVFPKTPTFFLPPHCAVSFSIKKKRNWAFHVSVFKQLKLILTVSFSLKALHWSIINQRHSEHSKRTTLTSVFLLFLPLQSEHTINPMGGQSSLKWAPHDPSRHQEVNIKHVWKDEGPTKMAVRSSHQLGHIYFLSAACVKTLYCEFQIWT